MGGDIQVKSRVGQGSRFWFELEVPMMVEPRWPAAATITGYDGPRRNILVVDDVAENRAVVAALLRPLDFELIKTANGRKGLD